MAKMNKKLITLLHTRGIDEAVKSRTSKGRAEQAERRRAEQEAHQRAEAEDRKSVV